MRNLLLLIIGRSYQQRHNGVHLRVELCFLRDETVLGFVCLVTAKMVAVSLPCIRYCEIFARKQSMLYEERKRHAPLAARAGT